MTKQVTKEVLIYCGEKGRLTVDLSALDDEVKRQFLEAYAAVTQDASLNGASEGTVRVKLKDREEQVTRLQTITQVLSMYGAKPRLNMGRPPGPKLEEAPF